MKALITGIAGQDGSYLAEFLIAKGYEVHGIVRPTTSRIGYKNLNHLYGKLILWNADLVDQLSLLKVLENAEPDEIYNLGGQSYVTTSFAMPQHTFDSVAIGTLNILEAVTAFDKNIRVYQAGSSEMFGASPAPQDEKTPFHPRSPYGVAKLAAHWSACHYRERGLFVANGILFNHESPRRPPIFVTRKITQCVAEVKTGQREHLPLGNLTAKRDWGYAPDYVRAMWAMLQRERADDYVIATGETHSVEEFVALAFTHAGLGDWRQYVEYDPTLLRPLEVDALTGNSAKARQLLSWKPTVDFSALVKMMVDHDIAAMERVANVPGVQNSDNTHR